MSPELSGRFTLCPCPQVLKSLGGPDLARSIISPHLCRDAVDFLHGHLTPKETSIFEVLGDGWTKPRSINHFGRL